MDAKGKMIIVCMVLIVIAALGLPLMLMPEKTTMTVTLPSRAGGACACAVTATPAKKYLIFWKEKDGYKASPILFQSIEAASAAIPRDAEEARIVPVRID